jgi:hypothetical protein
MKPSASPVPLNEGSRDSCSCGRNRWIFSNLLSIFLFSISAGAEEKDLSEVLFRL